MRFSGLIFWRLVIAGFIGLVLPGKYLLESSGAKKEEELALEILKRRYASGEISKEGFEEEKKYLLE